MPMLLGLVLKAGDGAAVHSHGFEEHGERSYPERSIAVVRAVNHDLVLSFRVSRDTQNDVIPTFIVSVAAG